MLKSLLPLLLFLSIACMLRAQDAFFTTESPPTRALIVGISKYQDPKIPKLNYAHRDAEAFAKFLSDHGWVKNPKDVHLLVNDQATSGNLVKEFSWLLKESKAGDRVIIYFAGHGDKETLTSSGLGYLLTYNSPPNNFMAGGAFNLRDLQTIIKDLSAKEVHVILITDACKSGEGAGELPGASAVTANLSQQYSKEVKLLSCQPNELSKEGPNWGGGRGVFSFYLVEGLSGAADKNGNGEITVVEIENYLEEQVSQAVRSQLPFAVGDKNQVLTYVKAGGAPAPSNNTAAPAGNVTTRGLEQPAAAANPEADEWKKAFEKALKEQQLLEPMRDCANWYYRKLTALESLSASDKEDLTYSFVAALTDGSQEVYNTYMQADSAQLATYFKKDPKFSLYPAYLGRACELLGEDHYLYKTFKLRQLNFESLVERVKYYESNKSAKAQEKLVTQQKEMDEFLNDLGEEYEYLQENPNVYYDKALFAYNNGQYEEALTNAQKATELSPQWALPYNLQGLCLMYGNGDYEAAEAPLRKAVELVEAEQKPYFQFDLAQALYSNNDHEGAIELLNEVTQAQPDFAHAWNWLGINYRYTKEYDPGKAACQHALDLEPGNPQYQYEMGAMLYDSGDVEASIPYFQTCLLLESQEDMYWRSNSKITLDWIQQNTQFPLLPEEEVRARISSEVNLEEESFYDDAGNLNVELLKEKAEKSFNEGDYQQAEELLYMLLDDGQSDPLTLFYLGMVFNGQYRLEEALDLFQFTLEMAEAEEEGYDILEPFFQFGLANAYFLMDDLDNAEAAALKSIDEANDFFEGYYLLSSIYDLQGDYERSQEMLDKYVEMGGVLEEFDDH